MGDVGDTVGVLYPDGVPRVGVQRGYQARVVLPGYTTRYPAGHVPLSIIATAVTNRRIMPVKDFPVQAWVRCPGETILPRVVSVLREESTGSLGDRRAVLDNDRVAAGHNGL